MAENKKSVLLYCDIIHTVKELSDEEAGKLFKHYLAYINDLNPDYPDKLTQIVFEPIKQNLKRDLLKWKLIRDKRSEAGKAAGIKSGEARRTKTNQNEPIVHFVNDSNQVQQDKVKDKVKDIKNILLEKESKEKKFNFKKSLLDYGFEKKLIEDWLLVRKNKKSTNSETALSTFMAELENRPCDKNDILKIIVSNSWSGFKWKWYDNLNLQNNQSIKPLQQTKDEKLKWFKEQGY